MSHDPRNPDAAVTSALNDPNSNDRLVQVVTDYLASVETGKPMDTGDIIARYPDLAPELTRFFADEQLVKSALSPLRMLAPTELVNNPTSPPRVGFYEILGELGQGGMGVVYQARDSRLGRLVALKMLKRDTVSDRDIARFRAEAANLAKLQHPHVVAIHEFGEAIDPRNGKPSPYFALEFVSGGSLDNALREVGPMPPAEAAALLAIVARAVGAAHNAGMVHRDLKPGNVLLAPPIPGSSGNTRFGFPKVADFGLSRDLCSVEHQTASGDIMGTPFYMSPEQAVGDRDAIAPATDVWALGVMLYQFLTGSLPFRGDSVLATLDKVRSQSFVPPHELCPNLPDTLETICRRCLQKSPHERYPNANLLADDLQRFLAGQPIAANSPTVSFLQPRPAVAKPAMSAPRRFVMLASAILVVVAAVSAGILGSGKGRDKTNDPKRPKTEVAVTPIRGSIDIVVYESISKDPLKFEPATRRQKMRLHELGALPLSPNDWIRIEIELNRMAYMYVLWVDTEGKTTPLWPWINEDWNRRPAEATRARLMLPETDGGISPLGPGPAGIESLVLLCRDSPLTDSENRQLEQISRVMTRKPLPNTAQAVWLENGDRVLREVHRGPIRIGVTDDSFDPELQVRHRMKDLADMFPYSRAVCFGNTGQR